MMYLTNYQQEERDIAFLMKQEVNLEKLLREYNRSRNPNIMQEINRKFNLLSQGWDNIKKNNIK